MFFIMEEFVPKIFYLLLYADKKIILRLKIIKSNHEQLH